jgi:hypothetical protein
MEAVSLSEIRPLYQTKQHIPENSHLHIHDMKILLHVWGSLGSATLALYNNALAQHCCVSLVTQQCWTVLDSLSSNNVISSIVTLATIRHMFLWYSEFYWHPVCVGICSSEDVFWNRVSRVCVGIHSSADVYLATDSLLVGRLSSYREIVRGAREFIWWTVKTFDHRRGW